MILRIFISNPGVQAPSKHRGSRATAREPLKRAAGIPEAAKQQARPGQPARRPAILLDRIPAYKC